MKLQKVSLGEVVKKETQVLFQIKQSRRQGIKYNFYPIGSVPAEKKFFWEKAKEATGSRFEGGVHFRSDNVVGMEMGKKIGELLL
jgi:hypothetical protein